jgi:crossover junction endodeoxyribonuclease RuvC
MIILGIDPGIGRMGYAIVKSDGPKASLIDCGCITTPPKTAEAERLLEIKHDLDTIIKKWKPEVLCIESLFFATNAKTAMSVGQARGVAIVTAAEYGLDIIEITPLQVKMSITGYGKAEKSQVQKMLLTIFGIKKIPKPDDAADAAAIAWAGIGRIKYARLK